jgi:hypothetical protein
LSQEIINSNENISLPNGVSFWFDEGYTGVFRELGDLLVDGISLAPEFFDHRSYRFGINALRKRLLTAKNASITMTLNEMNIQNLQRGVFGGVVTSGNSFDAFEGRKFTVRLTGGNTYVDLDNDAGETNFGDITITGLFADSDVLFSTNLISADLFPDTDGRVFFDSTDTGLEEGDEVYVQYEKAVTGLFKTEIFGSTSASIEGAAQFQVLSPQGGVLQIWSIASVSLAPNGDMPVPLDGVQTIPLIATLQERSGTFGNIYTA